MNRSRILALAAAPTALLIGLAVPASAADAPAPKASASASSACFVPAVDQVLTADEGIQLFQACSAVKSAAKSWRWMGNYGSVYDVARVANRSGVGAGALITQANATGGGLIPTFMYY